MPPSIVALPPRSGSMRFPDEDVTAILELFKQCSPGQAVRLTDEPDESDNTARRRAELLKEQVTALQEAAKKSGHGPVIPEGLKIRGHVLTEGEPTVTEHESKKTPGKKYKVTAYPKNWAAVSLVPEGEPDEAPPASPENPPADPPAEPPAPATAAASRRR